MQRLGYSLYVVLLVYVVWFLPVPSQETVLVNVVPLHTIKLFIAALLHGYAPLHVILANLVGNIVLTIPLGLLLFHFFGRIPISSLVLLALVIPFHIELGQLFLHVVGYGTRTVDIDDILLNGIGIVLGYFSARWLEARQHPTKGHSTRD